MRNLIILLFRYSAVIVFLLLEFISFYLIINYNKSQNEIWAHSSNIFTGNVNKRVQKVEDFVTLQTRNDSLLTENANLLQSIINFRIYSDKNSFQQFENASDSLSEYNLIPANVCAKTLHLRNNFLTLCKGEDDGIQSGMGVISKEGVVGIIKSTSANFATVLMIINSQSRISAKVLNKEYPGNLFWQSADPRKMKLMDVPKHADIKVGDTIVTSGYSISFPALIPIGKIDYINIIEGSNSYNIDVELDYDLSSIEQVYVVDFKNKEEKEKVIAGQDE